MSKSPKNPSRAYKKLAAVRDIERYVLKSNGLRVVYVPRTGTGVVSSHIVYNVGSKDEGVGETGVTHMLEHMLFKPTVTDLKAKRESHAMCFEKETGVLLNANTWRDRTTYFFSYPKEHFTRAITIEAERMRGLVLSDKEFLPERNNVLSEFDMVNGDPYFTLSQAMNATAFMNHPYRHEVIGFREDIEQYTTATLQSFYDRYYWPNNATLIVVGDIERSKLLATVYEAFSAISASPTPIERLSHREPEQLGVRRTAINRKAETALFALGIKHPGVRDPRWYHYQVLGRILTDGPDSILEQAFVDTGIATAVSFSLEPSQHDNLMSIFISLSKEGQKKDIESLLLNLIKKLTPNQIKPYLKKIKAQLITSELFDRASSLGLADELVEYVATDMLEEFYDTERIIDSITPAMVAAAAQSLLEGNRQTIGTFNYPLLV